MEGSGPKKKRHAAWSGAEVWSVPKGAVDSMAKMMAKRATGSQARRRGEEVAGKYREAEAMWYVSLKFAQGTSWLSLVNGSMDE